MAFYDNEPTCDPCQSSQVLNPRTYTDTFTNRNYAFVLLDTSGGDTDSLRTLYFDFLLPQYPNMAYAPLVPAGAEIRFYDSANVLLATYSVTLTQVSEGGSPFNARQKVQGNWTPTVLEPIPQDSAYMTLEYTYTNYNGTNVQVFARAFYFTAEECQADNVYTSVCYATNWIVYIGECGLDFCDDTAPITLRVNLNGGGFISVGTYDGTKALAGTITLPSGQFAVSSWFDDTTNKFYAFFEPGLDCEDDAVAVFVDGVQTYDLEIVSRSQLLV